MKNITRTQQKKLANIQAKIGRNIKHFRNQAGLSQYDMEARGFNLRYYREVECGRGNPTVEFLYRVAQALAVDLINLLE